MSGAITGKSIALQDVSKRFGETVSLDGISLDLPAGQFSAILGPSGCGKSTLLRVISGLEAATEGRVRIDGQDVTQVPPAQRGLSMVFQNYALFPHLSVAENILFGLRVARVGAAERKTRLAEVADLLELTPYLARKPAALSGGQQQRVALGRAVISRRPVCLMDEPLSNLDARLRDEMRREIRHLQKALGFTMVYVTHDQTEAITMADQVVLMRAGRIEQVASPQDIYLRPATPFVAQFIGTPPMNLLPAQVFGAEGDRLIGLRPEALKLAETGPLTGQVRAAEFLGADTLIEADMQGHTVLIKHPGALSLGQGAPVACRFDPADAHVFDTQSQSRIDAPDLLARLSR